MKLTPSQIDDLIQYMQGTCISIDDGCNRLFNVSWYDLDMETLEEFDQHLFCCEGCGWWYDIGEQSHEVEDEMVCKDCEDEYID